MPINPKIRVGAVTYFNTLPLIWGMLHGRERDEVELSFALPSVCADEVEKNRIPVGLVPVAEIARQNLQVVPGVGITCFGAVRSILLFSKVPWARVQTIAADLGSRTSVALARVILRERFGVRPCIALERPALHEMLATADAALIIGDPALRIVPDEVPFEWLDLGAEWRRLTNLPMVFAAWAGKPGIPIERVQAITLGSYEYGKDRIDEIIEIESGKRQIPMQLAHRYLREHIHFQLGPSERSGLQAFFELAGLSPAPALAVGT